MVLTEDLIGAIGWKDMVEFFQIMHNGIYGRNENASAVTKDLFRYVRGEVLGQANLPVEDEVV